MTHLRSAAKLVLLASMLAGCAKIPTAYGMATVYPPMEAVYTSGSLVLIQPHEASVKHIKDGIVEIAKAVGPTVVDKGIEAVERHANKVAPPQ